MWCFVLFSGKLAVSISWTSSQHMIWRLSLGVEHFHFGRDYKIVNQHRFLTDCRDKRQLRSDRDIVFLKNEVPDNVTYVQRCKLA